MMLFKISIVELLVVGCIFLAELPHWAKARKSPTIAAEKGPRGETKRKLFLGATEDLFGNYAHTLLGEAGGDGDSEDGSFSGEAIPELEEVLEQGQLIKDDPTLSEPMADIRDEDTVMQPIFPGSYVESFVKLMGRGLYEAGIELGEYDIVKPPFPVQYYEDGVAENVTGTNQYAWAMDYNEDCGVGCVIHSGGTQSSLFGLLTTPTMTCRDSYGRIIAQHVLGMEYGIRSMLIFKCIKGGKDFRANRRVPRSVADWCQAKWADEPECREVLPGKVVVYTGNVSPQGNPQIYRYVVNIHKNIIKKRRPVTLGKRVTSVRSLAKLNDCQIMFSPLADLGRDNFGTFPRMVVYDTCTKKITKNKLFNVNTGKREMKNIWDAALGRNGMVYLNLIGGRKDPSKMSGMDFIPHLYVVNARELLSDGNDGFVNTTEIPLGTDLDVSSFSLLPIDDGRGVVACTLSGFVYQLFASDSPMPEVSLSLIRNADPFLASLEMSRPQECFVSFSDGRPPKKTTFSPQIRKSSPYVWDITACGQYVFVGSLDFIRMFGDQIFYGLLNELEVDPEVELQYYDEETRETLLEFGSAAIIAQITGSNTLTPGEMGFDVFYIDRDVLLESPTPTWLPVTLDGFRSVSDTGEFTGYNPLKPVIEGVRNMACHTDIYGNSHLVIGTAAFETGQPSGTFVMDLNGKKKK